MRANVGKHRSTSSQRKSKKGGRWSFRSRRLSPAEVFVASFLGLIAFGTLCLKLLPGLYTGDPLSWGDAVFTATSAVCVTGLIVVDTATYFTPAGQAVLLLLIQLGGLGMLVLSSVIISALGGRPSIRTETVAKGGAHVLPYVSARDLIRDIVRFTLFFESLGAVILFLIWGPKIGWSNAAWPALFHSVSAFCNAGFSTNSASLVDFNNSPATLIVISLLILAGGIGFITMEEIQLRLRPKSPLRRLSVHSKLVLLVTLLLLVVGWGLFALFEWDGVLKEMSVVDKLSNSFFMSVTPRTAGFNSIDYAATTDSTSFLTILLMMIGGCPGSTAGGMKTTTFALLGLVAWSRLRSQSTATFARRSIPEETIQRATGLYVIATSIVVLGVFALSYGGGMITQERSFLVIVFEAVSAFNTVGLSMGVTQDLNITSRWIVIVLMFVGRTGPLSIAAALIARLSQRSEYRLAYEDVMVG
ncbi:MAG: TrkH family potassium uptake protein [Planctomycetaceae bacterium]